MKKYVPKSLLLTVLCIGHVNVAMADETTMSLAGTWEFRLDAEDVGVAEQWFGEKFEDVVQLPGTTDENQKGIKKDEQCIDRLSRVWYWKSPAWYEFNRRSTKNSRKGNAMKSIIFAVLAYAWCNRENGAMTVWINEGEGPEQ